MVIFTITSATWYLAGISVGVVFSILIVLVAVLNIFSMIAKSSGHISLHHHPSQPKPLAAGEHEDAAQDDHLVVVATAIYLYLNSAQDEESGVITLKDTQNPGWHAVLNPRL